MTPQTPGDVLSPLGWAPGGAPRPQGWPPQAPQGQPAMAMALPPPPALPAQPSLRNRCRRRVTGEQRALSPATPPWPAPLGPPSQGTSGPPGPTQAPRRNGCSKDSPIPSGIWVENSCRGALGPYKFYWPLVTVSRGTFALPAVAQHRCCRPPVPPQHAMAPPLSRALCSGLGGAEAAPTRDTLAQVGAACLRTWWGDRGALTWWHPAEPVVSYRHGEGGAWLRSPPAP